MAMKYILPKSLYGTPEAAAYLGVEPTTLDNWACTKRYNLKYIKVGRLRKYRREDLDQFLAERTIVNMEAN